MRLLVVTYRLPEDLCTGDRTTIHHLLKYLSQRHEITFVSLIRSPEQTRQVRYVAPFCKRLELIHLPRWRSALHAGVGLFSPRPLQLGFFHAHEMSRRIQQVIEEEQIDVAYGYHLRSAQYLDQIRGLPTVLDLKPVQTLNLQRMKDHISNPVRRALYQTEFRRVRNYEPSVVSRLTRCLVISDADRKAIDPQGKLQNILVNPHGLDPNYFVPDREHPKIAGRIVFSGNMSYDPNVDAIVHFANHVYPLIRQMRPHVTLTIVGKNPKPSVASLARDPSIEVTGFVDDIRPYLNCAEVAVNPLRIGAGLQNKVLEAMSLALPLVMTKVANEGIQATPGVHAMVADSTKALVATIVRLLDEADLRERIGRAAREWILEKWSWERHFEPLEQVLVELAQYSRASCDKVPVEPLLRP